MYNLLIILGFIAYLLFIPFSAWGGFLENIQIPWTKLYAAFLSPILSFIGFVIYGKIIQHKKRLSLIELIPICGLEVLIIGVFFYAFLQIVIMGLVSLITVVTFIFFLLYILIFITSFLLFYRIITKKY